MLLLRFVGVFLLRLAARRFCGLLFHEPPRKTRLGHTLLTPGWLPLRAKPAAWEELGA